MTKMLLIDDNPIDLLVNEKIIKTIKPDLQVSKYLAAEEALKNLSLLSSDELPNYILLDIKMPIMSGFDFLDQFEQIPLIKKHPVKVIMVSSSIDPMDREKAKANQFVVDFLEKPLNLKKVQACKSLQL